MAEGRPRSGPARGGRPPARRRFLFRRRKYCKFCETKAISYGDFEELAQRKRLETAQRFKESYLQATQVTIPQGSRIMPEG